MPEFTTNAQVLMEMTPGVPQNERPCATWIRTQIKLISNLGFALKKTLIHTFPGHYYEKVFRLINAKL